MSLCACKSTEGVAVILPLIRTVVGVQAWGVFNIVWPMRADPSIVDLAHSDHSFIELIASSLLRIGLQFRISSGWLPVFGRPGGPVPRGCVQTFLQSRVAIPLSLPGVRVSTATILAGS